MKYKCSDGVDRDSYIEAYLLCQDMRLKLGAINLQIGQMRRELDMKMSNLRDNKLGAVGLAALKESYE